MNLDTGLVTGFASIGLLAPVLVSRSSSWVRLLVKVALFAGLSATLPLVVGSPLHPHFDASPGERFLQQALEAAWWLMAARALVGLGRMMVVIEHKPRETRLVSDLGAGVIYVGAVLAIINFAFDVPVRGLLATSGVIAIVLGLALQSTMADLFSGIALGVESPYQRGDLVWFEGGIEGTVIEVNWRSTHVQTGDDDIAVLPNSLVAKSRLINRSHPTPVRSDSVTVTLNPLADPDRCIAILGNAALACTRLLGRPAPSVSMTALQGDGARYSVNFAVASTALLPAARTELLRQIHRHIRFTGIAVATPGQIPSGVEPSGGVKRILDASDHFRVLGEAARDGVAARMVERSFQPGEMLIRQGASAGSVLMIGTGTASITSTIDGLTRRLGSLSPGNFIGLVGLLVGEPYGVSATALTPCTVYELSGADLKAIMSEYPLVADALIATARQIHASIASDRTMPPQPPMAHNEQLVERLRAFFGLARSSEPA